MSCMPAYRAMSPAAWAWTPLVLGASLLAWWDAERSDLITQSGGAVSSCKDIVGGYDLAQSTGASKPTYSATSFNGRPGMSFDGNDDELSYASTAGLPVGATACGVWVLADQLALAADASTRVLVSWGGTTAVTRREVRRTVPSGVNRANTSVGDGSASVASTNASVDFSGRHVQRAIIGATAVQQDIDAVAGPSASVVPNTGTTRFRLGATAANTAANFASAVVSTVIITNGALTADQTAQLYAYLNRRL